MFFDTAYDGSRVLLHVVDDYSRLHIVFPLPRRGVFESAIKDILSWISTHCHEGLQKVKCIRMDNDTALSNDIKNLFKDRSIQLQTTAPYTPAQNGIAERAGGVIATMARTMRISSSLPKYLWPEVVKAASYILNRVQRPGPGMATSYEMAMGKWLNLANLRAYGCCAYVLKKPGPSQMDKLEERAYIGYLVGYEASNI